MLLSRLAIYSKTKLMPGKKIDPRIEQLVLKLNSGQLTEAEKPELEQWYASFEDSLLIEDEGEGIDELRQRLYSSILKKANIEAAGTAPETVIMYPATRRWLRVAAAAAIIVSLAGVGYLVTRRSTTPDIAKAQIHDVAPGGNKAILTLADGKQIILDSARTGQVAKEQNTAIEKTGDGNIRYMPAGTGANPSTTSSYNTISTPRGGRYAITLADGTKVILNAASSLRFPTAFTGNDRSVRLSGEAWFEITPDKLHPFIVTSGDQDLKVLGTSFNLNAYEDEPSIITTLLNGSVIVSSRIAHQSHSLSPGQQSILTGAKLSISEADIEEATAWKNGYFMFESEGISTIMRKIARWYDVDIKFDGPPPTDKFNGSIQRFVNVSQVLNKLALTNKVHFTIEGRTIIVHK